MATALSSAATSRSTGSPSTTDHTSALSVSCSGKVRWLLNRNWLMPSAIPLLPFAAGNALTSSTASPHWMITSPLDVRARSSGPKNCLSDAGFSRGSPRLRLLGDWVSAKPLSTAPVAVLDFSGKPWLPPSCPWTPPKLQYLCLSPPSSQGPTRRPPWNPPTRPFSSRRSRPRATPRTTHPCRHHRPWQRRQTLHPRSSRHPACLSQQKRLHHPCRLLHSSRPACLPRLCPRPVRLL